MLEQPQWYKMKCTVRTVLKHCFNNGGIGFWRNNLQRRLSKFAATAALAVTCRSNCSFATAFFNNSSNNYYSSSSNFCNNNSNLCNNNSSNCVNKNSSTRFNRKSFSNIIISCKTNDSYFCSNNNDPSFTVIPINPESAPPRTTFWLRTSGASA